MQERGDDHKIIKKEWQVWGLTMKVGGRLDGGGQGKKWDNCDNINKILFK